MNFKQHMMTESSTFCHFTIGSSKIYVNESVEERYIFLLPLYSWQTWSIGVV